MSTPEEKYISLRRLTDFKTLLESEYNIDKHSNQIQSLLNRGTKNLLKITATSQTTNGVTFTVADGIVTTTGTSGTNGASIVLATYTAAKAHELILSGTPLNDVGAYIDYIGTDWSNQIIVNGGSAEEIWSTKASRIRIVIPKNVNVDGLVFKPMLCTVKDYVISPEFVPYVPGNRELYDMILSRTKSGIMTIDKELTSYDSAQSKLRFEFYIDTVVPDFQLRQIGLIATSNAEIKYQLTLDTVAEAGVTFIKIMDIPDAKSNTLYYWTKTAVSVGDTWYVVPFMKYDNGDDIYLKYGHLYSITVNDGGTLTIIRICKE